MNVETVVEKLANGKVRTNMGLRRMAGNADVVVGRQVTVVGDLIIGWRRRQGMPVTQWVPAAAMQYRFADSALLKMYYVNTDFTEIVSTVDIVPPEAGMGLALHCYDATSEFMIWSAGARRVITKNNVVTHDFTVSYEAETFYIDGYVDGSDLKWAVFTTNSGLPVAAYQYTNATVTDSCVDYGQRIEADIETLVAAAETAAQGVTVSMSYADDHDVYFEPTYAIANTDESHVGSGQDAITLLHAPIALHLVTTEEGVEVTGWTITGQSVTMPGGWPMGVYRFFYDRGGNLQPLQIPVFYLDQTGETLYDESYEYAMYQTETQAPVAGDSAIVGVDVWSMTAYVSITASCEIRTKNVYNYIATAIYGTGADIEESRDEDEKSLGNAVLDQCIAYGPASKTTVHDRLGNTSAVETGNKDVTATTSVSLSDGIYTVAFIKHYQDYTATITGPEAYDTTSEFYSVIDLGGDWAIRKYWTTKEQWYGTEATVMERLYHESTLITDGGGHYGMEYGAWKAGSAKVTGLLQGYILIESSGDPVTESTIALFDNASIVTTRFA